MNTLKSILLLSVTLIFTNSALAASHKEVINNNEFNETEKIIAQMYYKQHPFILIRIRISLIRIRLVKTDKANQLPVEVKLLSVITDKL